ncbi:MAG: hypothetical protein NC236_02345 [Mycoplasma sp.]|nr:hypothetical protein [Mycoplasma sp.]
MKSNLWKTVIKLSIVIIVVTIIIFPVYYTFSFSLFDFNKSSKNNISNIFPNDFSFSTYKDAFEGGYWNAFLFTFSFSLVSMIFKLIIFISAGYALTLKSRFNKLYFVLLLLASIIPENFLLIGLLKNFTKWNLNVGSNIIMGLAAPSIFSLFGILLFRDGFLNISNDSKKIMYIDNLTLFEKINIVILPKIKHAIWITSISSLIVSWNSYIWPSVLMFGTANRTLSNWIFSVGTLSTGGVALNIRMAGTFLFMLPMIVTYILFHKKIISSIKKTL